MTNRDLASLVFKLIGVYFVLLQFVQLAYSLNQVAFTLGAPGRQIDQGPDSALLGAVLMAAALTGLLLVAGVLFVAKAERLADWLVPLEISLPNMEGVDSKVLLVVALTAMGALQFASGSAWVIDWGVQRVATLRALGNDFPLPPRSSVSYLNLVEPGVKIVFGLALIFAPRWIIEKLRLPRG